MKTRVQKLNRIFNIATKRNFAISLMTAFSILSSQTLKAEISDACTTNLSKMFAKNWDEWAKTTPELHKGTTEFGGTSKNHYYFVETNRNTPVEKGTIQGLSVLDFDVDSESSILTARSNSQKKEFTGAIGKEGAIKVSTKLSESGKSSSESLAATFTIQPITSIPLLTTKFTDLGSDNHKKRELMFKILSYVRASGDVGSKAVETALTGSDICTCFDQGDLTSSNSLFDSTFGSVTTNGLKVSSSCQTDDQVVHATVRAASAAAETCLDCMGQGSNASAVQAEYNKTRKNPICGRNSIKGTKVANLFCDGGSGGREIINLESLLANMDKLKKNNSSNECLSYFLALGVSQSTKRSEDYKGTEDTIVTPPEVLTSTLSTASQCLGCAKGDVKFAIDASCGVAEITSNIPTGGKSYCDLMSGDVSLDDAVTQMVSARNEEQCKAAGFQFVDKKCTLPMDPKITLDESCMGIESGQKAQLLSDLTKMNQYCGEENSHLGLPKAFLAKLGLLFAPKKRAALTSQVDPAGRREKKKAERIAKRKARRDKKNGGTGDASDTSDTEVDPTREPASDDSSGDALAAAAGSSNQGNESSAGSGEESDATESSGAGANAPTEIHACGLTFSKADLIPGKRPTIPRNLGLSAIKCSLPNTAEGFDPIPTTVDGDIDDKSGQKVAVLNYTGPISIDLRKNGTEKSHQSAMTDSCYANVLAKCLSQWVGTDGNAAESCKGDGLKLNQEGHCVVDLKTAAGDPMPVTLNANCVDSVNAKAISRFLSKGQAACSSAGKSFSITTVNCSDDSDTPTGTTMLDYSAGLDTVITTDASLTKKLCP